MVHNIFQFDDDLAARRLGNPLGQSRNRADNEMLTALNHYTMEPDAGGRVPCGVFVNNFIQLEAHLYECVAKSRMQKT